MRMMRLVVSWGILGALCATVTQAQETPMAMLPVTYEGLKREIHGHRGKVVVVDFWASFCLSCQKAFPSFIEMQKKHAASGLVIISVSVDAPDNKENVDAANAFLRKSKPPFRNLLLNEPAESWSKKLDVRSLPCYYVFDRQGRWVRFGGSDERSSVNYDELEKVVIQLLNKK